MDIKKEPVRPYCLRRIVSPTCGLRPLSLHQNEALGSWRSNVVKSTKRKYMYREKKRVHLVKLARNAKEIEGMGENTQVVRGMRDLLCLPPLGAMAPANTTQYLMRQFYEDFQQRHRDLSLSTCYLHQNEQPGSPQNSDTTLDREEACLNFQKRDFEEQFGALW